MERERENLTQKRSEKLIPMKESFAKHGKFSNLLEVRQEIGNLIIQNARAQKERERGEGREGKREREDR